MKAMLTTTRMLALAGAMSISTVALATDAIKGEPSGQTAASSTAAMERSKAMRERMAEIRASTDPDKRKQLIEAQMKDMEAMMADGSCMMMGGKPGMMGGGMMGGMMGGMGMGRAGQDDMLAKRMEMMEKRMDMMQMMMQQNMGNMMRPAR